MSIREHFCSTPLQKEFVKENCLALNPQESEP